MKVADLLLATGCFINKDERRILAALAVFTDVESPGT